MESGAKSAGTNELKEGEEIEDVSEKLAGSSICEGAAKEANGSSASQLSKGMSVHEDLNENGDINDGEILDWDDTVDEVAIKDAELTYSEVDKQRLKNEAEEMKKCANKQFEGGNFRESAIIYTLGLRLCPLQFNVDRAVLYSNRAASKMKLGLYKSAIEDCTKAHELNPQYIKALWRRALLYEMTEKLDEALEDFKNVLELDPTHNEARNAILRLPDLINERNEKLKAEMMTKLKDLGNLCLRPFGLSLENFKLNKDPSTGGYSVNFKQSEP